MKDDKAYEVMQRILRTPVPDKNSIVNPIRKTPKLRSQTQINAHRSAGYMPEDVNAWSAKNFVTYFMQQYKIHMGGPYKTIYQTDIPQISQAMSFFAENGINKVEGMKGLIDWCFQNPREVLELCGFITPTGLVKLVNHYYQAKTFSKKEAAIPQELDSSLVEEMTSLLEKNARPQELFLEYGIPLAASYFYYHQHFTYEEAHKAVDALIQKWSKTDKKKLGDILRVSINNAPYPDTFILRDWREQWKLWALEYSSEPWWRSAATDEQGKISNLYFSVGQSDV